MASFFGGLAQGLSSGAGLADRLRERRASRAYRDDLGSAFGDFEEGAAPDFATARDVAARHGRWDDVQRFHGLSGIEGAREDERKRQLAARVEGFRRTGNYQGLNNLFAEHGQDLQRWGALEPHREVMGLDVREDPEGNMLYAPRIRNGQTGTTGPMTMRGSADPDDSVVAWTDPQFQALYSHLLPEMPEQYEVVHDPYRRGGVAQRSSTSGKLIDYMEPEEQPERPYDKAADGYHRYVDTGERVFPGAAAESPGFEPATPRGKAMAEMASAKKQFGEDSWEYEQLRTDFLATGKADGFKREKLLRDEFDKRSATFVQTQEAFDKITRAAGKGSAAGDLSLIFGFMKMVDPGSTVREGEFATAQNAAGWTERAKALYNRAVDGTRLTGDTRQDFLNQASEIYRGQVGFQKERRGYYDDLGGRYGLDTRNIGRKLINQDLYDRFVDDVPEGEARVDDIQILEPSSGGYASSAPPTEPAQAGMAGQPTSPEQAGGAPTPQEIEAGLWGNSEHRRCPLRCARPGHAEEPAELQPCPTNRDGDCVGSPHESGTGGSGDSGTAGTARADGGNFPHRRRLTWRPRKTRSLSISRARRRLPRLR